MLSPLHIQMLAAIAAEPTDEGKLLKVLAIVRNEVLLPEFDRWKQDTGTTSTDCAVSLGACGAISNIFAKLAGIPTTNPEEK